MSEMSDISPAFGLNEAERAAIVVMLLGDDQAASILSRLEPNELALVGQKMVELGDIEPDRIANAIEGFIKSAADDSLSSIDRHDRVRTVMTRAVGEVKASSVMQRIAPDEPQARSIEMAKWLAPPVLVPLIADEHPQAIALLLLQMEPEPAAEVLSMLPAALQPEIVHRIATLGPVSTQSIVMLEDLLAARIAERFGHSALTMGGPREAAGIINKASKAVEKTVMPAISERDRDLASAIEAEMVRFEDLFRLDAMSMGRLLRDVESEILVDALKGITDAQRSPFFAAMSTRAADGVRDEIDLRGRLRREDMERAQAAMIAKARDLAAEGEIAMGESDGEFV